jgi:hypothetical protein
MPDNVTATRTRASATPASTYAPLPDSIADWRAQLLASLRSGGPHAIAGAFALVVLMIAGSAIMWIGLPVLWLWIGSRMQHGLTPSAGPYFVIAVGLPTTMIIVAKCLRILDRAFARVSGFDPEKRQIPLPWAKSMRDARGSGRRLSVLDIIMLVSVLLAGVALGIWVAFFAGAPPSSVSNGGFHL